MCNVQRGGGLRTMEESKGKAKGAMEEAKVSGSTSSSTKLKGALCVRIVIGVECYCQHVKL